jgi:hypothetical protein
MAMVLVFILKEHKFIYVNEFTRLLYFEHVGTRVL